jgi:hypothetical protein
LSPKDLKPLHGLNSRKIVANLELPTGLFLVALCCARGKNSLPAMLSPADYQDEYEDDVPASPPQQVRGPCSLSCDAIHLCPVVVAGSVLHFNLTMFPSLPRDDPWALGEFVSVK